MCEVGYGTDGFSSIEEDSVAKLNPDRVDPTWPDKKPSNAAHPVSELAADRQGALSPFGDVTFPLPSEDLGYEHPVTEINK